MRPSTQNSPTPEELALVQARVATFGLFTAALGGTFLAFRLFTIAVTDADTRALTQASLLLHGVAVVLLMVTWLANRGSRTRSHAFVIATEALGFLGSGTAYVAMGAYIPALANPAQIVLLAVTFAAVARAAYVPTDARRTLVLTGVLVVPLAVLAWTAAGKLPDEVPELLMAELGAANLTLRDFQLSAMLTTIVWWSLTTALATGISSVIYGLRREMRDVQRLGQYTLEEKLGEGGMGIVYRARHGMLRRPTAVKLLPPERAGAAAIARFEREVRLTARLTHPNTVTIFDYGRTPDGVFYYAMELLDGATLHDVVEVDGPQPPSRVVKILRGVAGALAEAHAIGLIHRDVKPVNILLARMGGVADVAKVVDFGLVKELERDVTTSLTAHDTITGTPQYMSPEAITQPELVDGRSDLYALGAVGYYLLTGEHVFTGRTVVEVCSHHLHTQPEPPAKRLGKPVPEDLERLVLDCLAKDPDARPESADALVERLDACRDIPPWTRANAELWWIQHGPAIAARRPRERPLHESRTMEVDVRRRRDASSRT